MNIEITIVKTFCDFGHDLKNNHFSIFIRILAISYEKKLATLVWFV